MNYRFISSLSAFLLVVFWSCTSRPKESGTTKPDGYYTEQYRPQYHFSPEFGWMNDPNGMVYYDGEYHLFYQYYPDSTVWGPMYWGHAVSADLVHWEHLPIALYPDSLGYIFSGSAVVDWKNTSGFGSAENPPLIAIFTYHNPKIAAAGGIDVETQAIAFSLDKGRNWTKYEGNPVIPNQGDRDFRDPNVIWNENIQKWNLILSAHDRVKIYSSEDLKEWQYESEFGADAGAHGGVWECPDLFPLKVEGTDQTKWVIILNINPGGPNGGSGTQYFVGDFDGHQFIADSKETSWIDWGHDNYAGVTWSDVPKEDGRRIFMGWMSNWDYAQVVPTGTWRSAMTLPRSLSLAQKDGRYLLKSVPVKELDVITGDPVSRQTGTMEVLGERELELNDIDLNQIRLYFDFSMGENVPKEFGVLLENDLGERLKLAYSSSDQQFIIDRNQAGNMDFSDKFAGMATAPYQSGQKMQLEIVADAASVEVFVNGGELVMTEIFFSTKPFTRLKVFAEGNPVVLEKSEISGIDRIW